MKLVPTRRTDYAIRALLHLAQNAGERVKASDIAEAKDIPKGFLHQVLQELQRARLVTSAPSRKGGYSLARPAGDISILQIVESLEGPFANDECALRGGLCRRDDACALHDVWASAREALAAKLGAASLAEVAEADARIVADRAARTGAPSCPLRPS